MGTDEGNTPGFLVTQAFLRIYLNLNDAVVCASVCGYAHVSTGFCGGQKRGDSPGAGGRAKLAGLGAGNLPHDHHKSSECS